MMSKQTPRSAVPKVREVNRDLRGAIGVAAFCSIVFCIPISEGLSRGFNQTWMPWATYLALLVACGGAIAALTQAGLDAMQTERVMGRRLSAERFSRRSLAMNLAGMAAGMAAGIADAPVLCVLVLCVVMAALTARYTNRQQGIRFGWVMPLLGFGAGIGRDLDFRQSMILAIGLLVVSGIGMALAFLITRHPKVQSETSVELRGHGAPLMASPAHLLARAGNDFVWGLADRHTLALGPSRSGKTSGVVIPNACSWRAGSLVAVSTKQDVLYAALPTREQLGDVYLLDVLNVVSEVMLSENVRRVRWTPLRGCANWSTARARAAAMMGAGRKADTTDASHWATQGEHVLAPVFHAAALQKVQMRQVMNWLATAESLRIPLSILREHEASEAAAQLYGVISQDPRPRDSTISTVATAMHSYAGTVLEEASQATEDDWDPKTFINGANTLCIVAPLDSEIDDPAPIVVGVLAELYSAIRAQSDANGGRLTIPSLWILDEVAHISPLPRLPQWMAESAGRGLSMILGVQDMAQLEARWGRRDAATMWSNMSNKVVFPGISNTETLQQLETLAGKHWIEQESRSSGSSFGSGHSMTSTRTRSQIEVPRWPAASIYGLAPGSCLVFRPDMAEPLYAGQARMV